MVIMGIAGDIGVAAYGIVANLCAGMYRYLHGRRPGIQPVVSVNYGAGRMGNVLRTYLLGAALAFVLGGLFYLAALFFPDQIASVFQQRRKRAAAAHAGWAFSFISSASYLRA